MATSFFVSYSHRDKRWVDPGEFGLIPWLSEQLGRYGVQFWFDHALRQMPGENYKARLLKEIERADFAMLLVSQNFVGSAFIREYELPLIREQYEQGLISIVPILVGPITRFGHDELHWIADLQMIPSDVHPLVGFLDDQAAWEYARVEIVDAIHSRLSNRNLDHTDIQGKLKSKDMGYLYIALDQLAPAVPDIVRASLHPQELPGMCASLVEQLPQLPPFLRYWMYIVLGSIDSEEARQALKQGLHDSDEYARQGAADAVSL